MVQRAKEKLQSEWPISHTNSILIWVYPHKWGWPDLSHSNSNLSNSYSSSPSKRLKYHDILLCIFITKHVWFFQNMFLWKVWVIIAWWRNTKIYLLESNKERVDLERLIPNHEEWLKISEDWSFSGTKLNWVKGSHYESHLTHASIENRHLKCEW